MGGLEYQSPSLGQTRGDGGGGTDGPAFATSSVQRQFWLLRQMAPDSAAYNIAYAFRITGPLDSGALCQSVHEIVARHDVFRTTFAAQSDRLVQVIAANLSLDVPLIDLSCLSPEEANEVAEDMIRTEATRPFDLNRGPVLRSVLLKCALGEYVFVLVMHHIAVDLHAINMVFAELSTLYEARLIGAPCPLERPLCHYRDYARWEQEWLKGEEASSMLAYWQQMLGDHEDPLWIPTDRPRPAVPSKRGAEVPLEVSAELTADLKTLGRRAGMPYFGVLLSVYMVLLYRLTRQSSIVVGVPFTNRRQRLFQDLMGCCVNVLPIRLRFCDGLTFREVMQHVRDAMLGAHRCQEITLESMLQRLELDRTLSYNPLYQVGMAYSPPIDFQLPGLTVQPLDAHPPSAQLDLFASVWDADDEIRGKIEYSSDLFERTTVERFIARYTRLLEATVAEADQPVDTLAIEAEETPSIRRSAAW